MFVAVRRSAMDRTDHRPASNSAEDRRSGRSLHRKHKRASKSKTKRRSPSSSSSSSSTSSSRSKEAKKKKKFKRSRSSSSSSSSTSSSRSKEAKKKKKKQREAKKKLKREKKKKKKEKKVKKGPKKLAEMNPVSLQSPQTCLQTWQCEATEHGPDMTDEQKVRLHTKRPMTKEEYEARQSVIRRVLDPETGRTRLIRGDGEILEEIVSKERHKEINKKATRGDGDAFQKKLGISR